MLFSKERIGVEGAQAIHHLSVANSTDSVGVSNRVIVIHEGSDKGDGVWKCVKNCGQRCIHIAAAQRYLGQDHSEDAEEDGEESLVDEIDGIDICKCNNYSLFPVALYLSVATENQRRLQDKIAISYLPVLPPRWAVLPTDKYLYQRPNPLHTPLPCISITSEGSCACLDGSRSFFDPSMPIAVKECKVFTLTGAFIAKIELQSCPKCPVKLRRYIGPEPRKLGLFNFNNSSLFTHELLDEYTCAFTGSETPFAAWTQLVARRYEERYGEMGEPIPFVSGKTFRSVWFAYARLMQLEGDKSCSRCGEYPENIIWDGVSISFGRKHVNNGLHPPTIVGSGSPSRSSRPTKKQEWLAEPKIRKRLHDWILKGGLKVGAADSDKDPLKAVEMRIERLSVHSEVVEWLEIQNKHLAAIFRRELGGSIVGENNKYHPKPVYVRLFELVRQHAIKNSILSLMILTDKRRRINNADIGSCLAGCSEDFHR